MLLVIALPAGVPSALNLGLNVPLRNRNQWYSFTAGITIRSRLIVVLENVSLCHQYYLGVGFFFIFACPG